MQLLAVDPDPGTEALPVITHDLELSCDGCQLALRCMGYFYFEFFHISFIVSAGPRGNVAVLQSIRNLGPIMI